MRNVLPTLIAFAGIGHLGLLSAGVLVPIRLNWKKELSVLPLLHMQMYWTYGGYVFYAILSFGLICLFNAEQLAAGSLLARCLCAFLAIFWGVRLILQRIFAVKPYLTNVWLKLGYLTLGVLFAYFTIVFAAAAVWPVR